VRNNLIYLALKYQGEYIKIKKALLNKEKGYANAQAITIVDKNYPSSLLSLKQPPFVLFYKGDLSLLEKEIVAVVGSRNASNYSLECCKGLCLNKLKDKVIISGLALGIDTCAHISASKTIAVVGNGINYIYPKGNKALYERIIKEGLLLSEYPDNTLPLAYHFPFRNRIIAALAREIYVIETEIKSGTMTSVNHGLELGKEIFVLPQPLQNRALGNNLLLSEGANFISYEDIKN